MRKKVCVVCLLGAILMGCASVELEERSFPLMAAVGFEDKKVSYVLGFARLEAADGQATISNEISVQPTKERTFLESKQAYESHLNKITDYNHLKVLVLEEDLLEEPRVYNEMVESLAKEEVFPRNTYVCVIDDIEDLMEIEKVLPQDLGTYLEEYLVHSKPKDERMPTLGDLIDERENKELVLYLPYLETEETYVVGEGFYPVGLK